MGGVHPGSCRGPRPRGGPFALPTDLSSIEDAQKVDLSSLGGESNTWTVRKESFTKGERVLHVEDKKFGVIDSGPDKDGEYRVRYDDGEGSGYVKASGLRGAHPRLSGSFEAFRCVGALLELSISNTGIDCSSS